MEAIEILRPAIVLGGWTLVRLLVSYVARLSE
jgi:hypothetical protein